MGVGIGGHNRDDAKAIHHETGRVAGHSDNTEFANGGNGAATTEFTIATFDFGNPTGLNFLGKQGVGKFCFVDGFHAD